MNTNHSPSGKQPGTPAVHTVPAVSSETEENRYPIRRGLIGNFGFYGGLLVTRLIVRLRARGTENIPTQTPYVIAANHQTYVDGMLIGAFLPRLHFKKLASLTAKDLEDQHGLFGKLIVRVGRGIAVDRFGNPIRGLIIAKKKVEEGNILLVHPEGTRSSTGELGEMKDGAAYIALKSKVPLLPVFIEGGYEVFSRHMKWPNPIDRKTGKRRVVTVVFGKPLDPREFKTAKDMTQALVSWMEAQALAYRRTRGLAAT
ncbi:MAG: lysophospholipid acyltransferase family protein [Eubacteriales bacterium]|nr:lysophospholipid acyltransferase family protein [Eubacteriales bacterium]